MTEDVRPGEPPTPIAQAIRYCQDSGCLGDMDSGCEEGYGPDCVEDWCQPCLTQWLLHRIEKLETDLSRERQRRQEEAVKKSTSRASDLVPK